MVEGKVSRKQSFKRPLEIIGVLKNRLTLDIFFKEVTMKKVFLVLALLVIAVPAFGADVQLFFTKTATLPTAVPADPTPYYSIQNNTVTLYLWAKLNVTVVRSLAIDFDVVNGADAPIAGATFTITDINYGQDTAGMADAQTNHGFDGSPTWDLHAWDVTNVGIYEARYYDALATPAELFSNDTGKPYTIAGLVSGAELDDIKLLAFNGEGLRASALFPNGIFPIGVLQFSVTTNQSFVHMSTGPSAALADTIAATIFYGAGEVECKGDPLDTPLSDSVAAGPVYTDANADANGSTVPGDFDADGVLTFGDIPGFKAALADPTIWNSSNTGRDSNVLGDYDADLTLTFGDIPGFKTDLSN
jgi:hypothetical protein